MLAASAPRHLTSGRQLINHDIMRCTHDCVTGNYLYSGRALAISEPEDLIQLHPALQPLWSDITAHYHRIGLDHSESVIWDLELRHLGSHPGYRPSVFYFGPEEHRYWHDDAWAETVEYINSKNNFIALANLLGIDVPDTRCFTGKSLISAADISAITFPCYLKAAVSVAGAGIYRCTNEKELYEAFAAFTDDVPVQIQEELVTDTFLNLQYHIDSQELVRLAASEQILDGFSHQGNRVPPSFSPWNVVEPMAEWLMERGMKGIFAFDVAVVQTTEGLRFPAIECNPRFNGASYPTLCAHKLGIGEWTAMTLPTRHRTLSDIDLSDIEYNSTTGEGLIIINWGTVLEGRIAVLMAGSRAYQEALAVELEARL